MTFLSRWRANWSIERKLPLSVTALLLVVVLALTVAAYEEVRRAARVIAATRLERATHDLADLFQRSTVPRLTETRTAATVPAVAAVLQAGADGVARSTREDALSALRRIASDTSRITAVELQGSDGRVLLRNGDSMLHAGPPLPAIGDSAVIGPLQLTHDSIMSYEVRAAVRLGGRERALGQVVQIRRVMMSTQARQLIGQLIGTDVALLLGNADGAPWTDLAGVIPPPPATVRTRGRAADYDRGDTKMGAGAPIAGTPWALVVDLPRRQVYALANAYLLRMALIALAVVLAGALIAWWMSRRITTPLRRLTTAAEAIAGGHWEQRVDVAGRDEPGRLAHAFNAMATEVSGARQRLESEVQDRTRELQLAKERLEHTSEERYHTLFRQSPTPMWLYDPDTLRFVDVSDTAATHYGYSRDEFLKMTIEDIRPPEEVPRLRAALARAPGGMLPTGVYRHRTKDGTPIDAEVTRRRLDFGGRSLILSLATDVTSRMAAERALRELNEALDARVAERTGQLEAANRQLAEDVRERRRAEESVRASEERFRAVAETANDGIVSADSRGTITFFNRGAERIFGYPADVAIGQPLQLLMPARLRDAHKLGFARYLQTGEARVVGKTVELVGQRRDGTEFPIELSLASWRTVAGPSFTGIIRDITERKRIAEQLIHDAEQLEKANKELEAFSYSVSHDLRAPLRAIHGFARILIEEHAHEVPDEPRRLLGVIDENTRRMGRLIDDLLAFSRLGRKELDTTRVDMTDLVRAVAAELQPAEDADEPTTITVGALPAARGDRALLRQVITNLVQNAVKFSRGRPAPRIDVGTQAAVDGQNVYFVKDNGVGFDMRYAGKLFGVFQRLHSDAEFEGTGVGLATVQRIVHRHGGRVWAEAKSGEGATFFFTLPGSGEA